MCEHIVHLCLACVMSDCQQRHFHSIFLFFICFGYLDWHIAVCRRASWLVLCRCRARRWWLTARWRSSRTCRAEDRGRVGKGGREAWIEGPDRRVASRGGWHLGHQQVRGHVEWPCRLSQGGGRLGRQDTCRWGARTWYATRGPVWWFGPQNHRWWVSPGLGLKTRAEVPMRNGRHVAASGRLRGARLSVRRRGGRRIKLSRSERN